MVGRYCRDQDNWPVCGLIPARHSPIPQAHNSPNPMVSGDTIVQSLATTWLDRLPPVIGSTDNVRIIQSIEEGPRFRDSPLRTGQEPPLGSHLVTKRTFYSHHGIYVGGGRVIHYAGFAHGLRRGPVEEASLEQFAHGHTIEMRHDKRCFDRCKVVDRARSRLGEQRYDILRNNCEHFCTWALCDETRSQQVERLRSLPRVLSRWIEGLHLAIVQAVRGIDAARTVPCGK